MKGTAWIGFATMCIGMFMAILDVQVVATSLPDIQGALEMAPDQMSWVQTAYLIAEVIAIPLTGLLMRSLSLRWLFVGALGLFTVASTGCAASGGFVSLISWRVLQGLAGGTLIPSVFAAVFLLFPPARQGLATMLAGVLAVLAPTIGPIVGGWITETFSWHWLFLINLAPGVLASIVAVWCLPRQAGRLELLRRLDLPSLACLAIGLASFELTLKQAPDHGWNSPRIASLAALSVISLAIFARRSLRAPLPIVDLAHFSERNFAVGCLLSFILGIGLFGSVYLMPVFLAFVRGHDALEIGTIMLVTGVAQLLIAPLAVWLEQRVSAPWLSAGGFALFATGLALSTSQTPATDAEGMAIPQVIRGLAIMFCLLPPTRLALGGLPPHRIADASALFNLMRTLGGAIGIALIDTIIYGRSAGLADGIMMRLKDGDTDTAQFIGLTLELFATRQPGPPDAETLAFLHPLVEKAALTQAIDEAWLVMAVITLAALLIVPFARAIRPCQ
jgi:DHA2 family multidrug resistance protein